MVLRHVVGCASEQQIKSITKHHTHHIAVSAIVDPLFEFSNPPVHTMRNSYHMRYHGYGAPYGFGGLVGAAPVFGGYYGAPIMYW